MGSAPTALCLSLLAAPAAARDHVSFDFGWRHRTGLHAPAAPDDPPPKDPYASRAPAEGAKDYDDSSWAVVQLPHDALIGTAPSQVACPDGCSGRSYIPRNVLWYRKAFTIPTEWLGDAYWLDFEGSFRNTTIWINGALVASHACGYTPFRLHLHNLTNVVPGVKSSIAVYVRPPLA